MSQDWRAFWDTYRPIEAKSEHDLFVQVGKTVGGQPIPAETLDSMVVAVSEQLSLEPRHLLLDICCGNGIMTHALSRRVARVVGIDFSSRLIASARRLKSAHNIDYREGDAVQTTADVLRTGPVPDRALMNDSLGYFEVASLSTLLSIFASHAAPGFRFLVTGIPDDARKFSFYDTPARLERYQQEVSAGSSVHDGMGRWWRASEIETAGRACGFQVQVTPQPEAISRYRMDALMTLPD